MQICGLPHSFGRYTTHLSCGRKHRPCFLKAASNVGFVLFTQTMWASQLEQLFGLFQLHMRPFLCFGAIVSLPEQPSPVLSLLHCLQGGQNEICFHHAHHRVSCCSSNKSNAHNNSNNNSNYHFHQHHHQQYQQQLFPEQQHRANTPWLPGRNLARLPRPPAIETWPIIIFYREDAAYTRITKAAHGMK